MKINALDLSIFYPTDTKTNDIKVICNPNCSQRVHDLSKYLLPYRIPLIFVKAFFSYLLENRRMGVNYEAPLAKIDREDSPLIIFSHGLAGNKHIYSYILKEWASQGYTVVSIDHDETVYIPVADWAEFVEKRKPQLKDRVSSVTQVIEHIYQEKSSKSLFGVPDLRINPSQIFVSGHSFGGATALESGYRDPRIAAIILLDPWLSPVDETILTADLGEKPALSIRSHEFQLAFRGKEAIMYSTGQKANRVNTHISGYFVNSTHNTFMDGLFVWPREYSMLKYVTDIEHGRRLMISYLKLTEIFLENCVKSSSFREKRKGFEEDVVKKFEAACQAHEIKNEFILDTNA
jgi:predicted esterase